MLSGINDKTSTAGLPLRGVRLAVRRWRNMRGFGVHSPSAYALMRETVRPSRRYGLYAYHKLDSLLEGCAARRDLGLRDLHRLRATMRFILRLCQWLAPESVRITASGLGGEKLWHELPGLAGVGECRGDSCPELWIIAGEASVDDDPALEDALSRGGVLLFIGCDRSHPDHLYAKMSGGIRILFPSMTLLQPISGSALATYYSRLPSR